MGLKDTIKETFEIISNSSKKRKIEQNISNQIGESSDFTQEYNHFVIWLDKQVEIKIPEILEKHGNTSGIKTIEFKAQRPKDIDFFREAIQDEHFTNSFDMHINSANNLVVTYKSIQDI